MSDDEDNVNVELPQIWQYIHPLYNKLNSDSDEDEEDEDVSSPTRAKSERPQDYVKLSKRAPRLGQLIRFLNDTEDDEELQQMLLEKDPVTQHTLLQWAALNNHFMLAEYVVKRLKRGAFSFDPESPDVVVFNRWEEMRPDLPSAPEIAERQKLREQEKAERRARSAQDPRSDDDEEDEEDDEAEPTPEELVYDSLDEFHEEWGERGLGTVKRIGELGVYLGARLRDGTKHGVGQSLFPNGDCYAGEYADNQRCGRGVYWWEESAVMYIGEWFHNMRHGYGRIVYPDGSRFLGHWVKDAKSGEGRYTYADGSSYDGMWARNKKHGYGTYRFTDGSSFAGSFYHNQFISGEWRLACGTVRYIGNFDHDVPVGAGVFVHRCGSKEGTFQQEGVFSGGKWLPGTLKGSTKVVPRLEVIAPNQKNSRVPIIFGADCNGRTMPDLVRAANFEPLVRWVHSLPSNSEGIHGDIELRRLEVCSMTYDHNDAHRVVELRVRPLIVDGVGTRLRTLGAEILTLKAPTTRLFVLLERSDRTVVPLLLLERSLQFCCPDVDHMQYRLPTARITLGGQIEGEFVRFVGPALRLHLRQENTTQLIQTLRSNPYDTNAKEDVVAYIQELHEDAFVTLEDKLKAASKYPDVVTYVAVPLTEVAKLSSDALTVISATAAIQRRMASTLPRSTTVPQRPPTPLPPAPEARPELQPLYEAKAARTAAETGDDELV